MKHITFNLFKLELKRSFKSHLIWSFSLGLSLFLIVIIYPLVKDMMASMIELMESLDENSPLLVFMEDFGGFPTTGLEYYATECALILQLVGGIYAAILGFSIINKDEKEHVHEVMYTLPIKRTHVILTRILYVLFNLFTFTIVQFLLSYVGFVVISESIDIGEFAIFGVLNWALFFLIAMLSFGLSSFLKPNVSALISVAIPFPLYILTMVGSATDNKWLSYLKYISPFTFAEPVAFLKTHAAFNTTNLLLFSGLTLAITVLGIIKFNKRQMI